MGPDCPEPGPGPQHHRGPALACRRRNPRVYPLLNQSREEALDRLKEHAKALGANAVIGVAFDSSETGGVMTEVLAYGTAVVVEPETTAASPVRLG